MEKKIVVFDLDNTLRDVSAFSFLEPDDKTKTANWKDWQTAVCMRAPALDNFAVKFYDLCCHSEKSVTYIVTSSSFGTFQWLNLNNLPHPDHIIERMESDNSTPLELKRNFFKRKKGMIDVYIDDSLENRVLCALYNPESSVLTP